MFRPLYVGVRARQFGQLSRKLSRPLDVPRFNMSAMGCSRSPWINGLVQGDSIPGGRLTIRAGGPRNTIARPLLAACWGSFHFPQFRNAPALSPSSAFRLPQVNGGIDERESQIEKSRQSIVVVVGAERWP